jgi:hypothetical protein
VPWLLIEGQWKMLVDLLWLLELLPFWEFSKTNNFMMSLFPIIITKEILGRNVALTSFLGRIATIVARR